MKKDRRSKSSAEGRSRGLTSSIIAHMSLKSAPIAASKLGDGESNAAPGLICELAGRPPPYWFQRYPYLSRNALISLAPCDVGSRAAVIEGELTVEASEATVKVGDIMPPLGTTGYAT